VLKVGAVWLTALVLTVARAAPASASLAYPDHQLLLLRLLKLRIAVKPLAAVVPPEASPVAIVEIAIDGVRRFLCRRYPLEPLEQVFPDADVMTAESAHCNELWRPE
jgi:hypothetical protein